MMESPFLTTQAILAEPFDAVSGLRIIAKDNRSLSRVDRETLIIAAEELDQAYRMYAVLHGELVTTRQQLAAVSEQLRGARAVIMAAPMASLSAPVPIGGFWGCRL